MMLGRIIKADISARRKTLWKSVLYVTLLLVFMSLVFCYAATIKQGMKKADEVNESGKFFWVDVNRNEIVEKKLLPRVQEIPGVTSVYLVGQRHADLATDRTFTMEGVGTVDGCYYAMIFRDAFPVEFEREMAAKDLGPMFAAGRYIESNEEIACTQEILDCFGITDPNQAIGKVLEVSYEEMGISHVFSKRIVGVFNPNVFQLDYYDEQGLPMICFSFDELWNYISRPSEDEKNLSEEELLSKLIRDNRNLPNLWLFYEGYYDTFLHKEEVFDKLHEFKEEEAIVPQKDNSKKIAALEFQNGILVTILSVLCALLCAGLLCAYLLDMIKTITAEEEHYKVWVAMGLSRKKLFLLVFLEELIKASIGIIVAMSIGALFIFGFSKTLSGTIGVTVSPPYLSLLVLSGVNVGIGLLISYAGAAIIGYILKKKGVA